MRILLPAIALFCVFSANAQVGVGTTTPHSSAALDVSSSSKGFLAPRVALTAINAAGPIASPAEGLIVYNTATAGTYPNDVTPGLYVWNATANTWDRLSTARTNSQSKKLGIDLTASAYPQKVYHDIMWYQTSSGPITPSQVPWYCENVTKANQLAAWWLQKLVNELKGLENDYHWDQSHNSIIVNSGLLGKIVLGKTALGIGTVDMDNNATTSGPFVYTSSQYFTLIVGSNNNNELYTLEFNVGIDQSNPYNGLEFRIIYQTNSAAADGHTTGQTFTNMNSVAPQCKTRASFSPTNGDQPAIMAYPISIELNF